MIVKLKPQPEPTFEAIRLNDDTLIPLIRRLGGLASVETDATDTELVVLWSDHEARTGEYVVFRSGVWGGVEEVLSEKRFRAKYEEVPGQQGIYPNTVTRYDVEPQPAVSQDGMKPNSYWDRVIRGQV